MHNTRRTCDELLKEYDKINSSDNSSKKLKFLLDENDERDVYNITAPFYWNGERLLAGRVEARDSEHSEVMFFRETGEGWRQAGGYPVLQLQDPFVSVIDGLLVLGGVEIFPDPDKPEALCWRTIFYKGNTPDNLVKFAQGPDRMKDIRLLQLADRRILVAVRPQGELGGRGKIGFVILNSLADLNEESINRAQILQEQFTAQEWGGCNEMHLLPDGRAGILSHIACFDEENNRHYYSSCFIYDPANGEYTPMELIAVRADFAPGCAKRPDLQDVIFSGGLIRRHDGKAELYCGVSDAEAHMRVIDDPFSNEKCVK